MLPKSLLRRAWIVAVLVFMLGLALVGAWMVGVGLVVTRTPVGAWKVTSEDPFERPF